MIHARIYNDDRIVDLEHLTPTGRQEAIFQLELLREEIEELNYKWEKANE